MAMQVTPVILGVDVSKAWLDVHRHGSKEFERVENVRRSINALLKRYPTAAVAVEATNTYHETLVELALKHGLKVYLISGYQLKHYANSLGQRMRNDRVDAALLARLLDREIDRLRPYEPRSATQVQLRRLLKRRALLVKQQQQLRQSFAGIGSLKASLESLLRRLKEVIALIDKQLRGLARQLGWSHELALLQSIPGVGPLTALALLEAYRSGSFTHRDPYIAFLGLDVRTKDSGKLKGRRKLTKQGNPAIRRLLYNAAMATIHPGRYFEAVYLELQARGLSKIQALVVICRKIARLAFAILKNQSLFQPKV